MYFKTTTIVLAVLAMSIFLLTGLPDANAGEPSVEDMFRQIKDGGFVVLAVQEGKTIKVRNPDHFKEILADSIPTTFYLEEIDSGKRHEVGQAGGKKEGWGAKIFRFYCCLAGEDCCNK